MLRDMTESLTVSIEEVRAAANRALDAAESCLGPEVRLTVDYYWHLPSESAFDVNIEPTALTVGQVSDDVETIRGPSNASAETAWHDLSHLVGVLRALELAARS